MPSIMRYWKERAEQLSGDAEPLATLDANPSTLRAGNRLTMGIVAGVLLGSSLIGSAVNRFIAATPALPAVDLSHEDFSSACEKDAAACGKSLVLASVDPAFFATLQFASELPPVHPVAWVVARFPTEGTAGGNGTSSSPDGQQDVSGGSGNAGPLSGGTGMAGGTGGAGGLDTSRLLAIANLPEAAGVSGPTPPRGTPAPGKPRSVSPSPADGEQIASGAVPDAPAPAKKPLTLVPSFPADLTPAIARIIPNAPPQPQRPEAVGAPNAAAPLADIVPFVDDASTSPAQTPTAVATLISPQATPEPAAMALLALGLAGLWVTRRKA